MRRGRERAKRGDARSAAPRNCSSLWTDIDGDRGCSKRRCAGQRDFPGPLNGECDLRPSTGPGVEGTPVVKGGFTATDCFIADLVYRYANASHERAFFRANREIEIGVTDVARHLI